MHYLDPAMLPSTKRLGSLSVSIYLCVFSSGCARTDQPHVRQMVAPVYPIAAQSSNIEGVVNVVIAVGMDGRVRSARSSGTTPVYVEAASENAQVSRILIDAADENARQWLWGPFPPTFQFPWYHEVRYVFKLQGKPTPLCNRPIVRTHLPDQIESLPSRA